MVTVETIGRIRRAFLVDHKPIRQIVRELRISRKTVRKAIRGATEFRYERGVQPQPRLGEFVARLDDLLEANSKRAARERLTAQRLFELLRAEGYRGAYDSVQRHVRAWRRARLQRGDVFILLDGSNNPILCGVWVPIGSMMAVWVNGGCGGIAWSAARRFSPGSGRW
jgi:hypothetical protein